MRSSVTPSWSSKRMVMQFRRRRRREPFERLRPRHHDRLGAVAPSTGGATRRCIGTHQRVRSTSSSARAACADTAATRSARTSPRHIGRRSSMPLRTVAVRGTRRTAKGASRRPIGSANSPRTGSQPAPRRSSDVCTLSTQPRPRSLPPPEGRPGPLPAYVRSASQEDMVELLWRRGVHLDPEMLDELRLDLRLRQVNWTIDRTPPARSACE